MAVEFPRALLRERSHSWNLAGNVASPGQTGTGTFPLVRSDGGGFWTCTMSSVSLSGVKGSRLKGRDRQATSTLLWRAVRQICAGGVRTIVVPRNDALFRPWPKGIAPHAYENIPHSDGSLFGDDVGYYQAAISVVTYDEASLRDTTLGLQLLQCGPLQGGESFSIEHPDAGWRIYEIATVEYVDATHAVVTFNPPLRGDVPSGTFIEFDRPRCLMRLTGPDAMNLTVQPWTFNNADVSFIEAST